MADSSLPPGQEPGRILLVPVPGPPGDPSEMVTLRAGQTLQLPVWEQDGRQFVPAFTSEAELLRAVPLGSRYVSLPAGDLADLLEEDSELRVDAGPASGASFAIGQPAEEPTALLREVRAFCSGNSAIITAWLALVKLEGEPPQPLVGLELARAANPETVLPPVTARIEEAGLGPALVIPVDRDELDEFTEYLLSSTQPFWRNE